MLKRVFIALMLVMALAVSLASAKTSFIEVDEETGGNWSEKYGNDGYIFCNVNGPLSTVIAGPEVVKENDVAQLPDYIEDYTLGGGIQGYVWQIGDARPKILPQPDGTKTAACWFNAGDFTVDLPLKRKASYTLAVYIDDWEDGGRKQSIKLNDLDTGAELAAQDFENYGLIGKYAVFEVDTNVQIVVSYIASYANAVVSGVFFSGGTAAVSSAGKLPLTWGKMKLAE